MREYLVLNGLFRRGTSEQTTVNHAELFTNSENSAQKGVKCQ